MLTCQRIDRLLVMPEQLTRENDVPHCRMHMRIDRERSPGEGERSPEIPRGPCFHCQAVECPLAFPPGRISSEGDQKSVLFRRSVGELGEIDRIAVRLGLAVDQLGRL